MRILLLCHGFNVLTQRLHIELREHGHDVSVELDINDATTRDAVRLFGPDLILAPYLKRAIPGDVWRSTPCLIVHPGPPGDRGPASLDWAILQNAPEWGVTVLQANGEMDAGPIWAHRKFPMRVARKSSIYRHEVTEAAVDAVLEALCKIARGEAPEAQRDLTPIHPSVKQTDRAIDWAGDSVASALRKIAASDGAPGVRAQLFGQDVLLFNARPAQGISGPPGDVAARSGPALGVALGEGGIWIGHMRRVGEREIKLPATRIFADETADMPETNGWRDIAYEEANGVGYLRFEFLNGAMGTEACVELRDAWRAALQRPTKAIVLMGGQDHWSNGLDLNQIEAASSAADESWRNINAIDDLAEAILRCDDRLVISALCGGAGAGGAFLARAADEVWLRRGVVLNPHYKDMGNLYGSEFW
ncbi:MAG: enoyl-CoA hydratase-related protein, partial [Neomegalonema sp.]|nr:enoyl-CoA hydratase-related protein [Neomegalonema sp.]